MLQRKKSLFGVITFICLLIVGSLFIYYPKINEPAKNVPEDKPVEILGKNSSCSFNFKRYMQSDFERKWETNSKIWGEDPCKQFNQDDNKAMALKWLNFVSNFEKNLTHHDSYNNLGPMSAMVYEDECNHNEEVVVPIEPVALIMRHPYVCEDYRKYILNKSYMQIDSQFPQTPNLKFWMFDLGASSWSKGLGGSSQSWFYEVFKKRGANWAGWYLWEGNPIYALDDTSMIPSDIVDNYYYYNEMAETKIGSDKNPLTLMKKFVKKEDYVIFKLDIDFLPVEYEFIKQLMEDPELLEIVDEFFFEHHIRMKPMSDRDWMGTIGTPEQQQTMEDSMKIFLGLRRKGVRAHVWV